MEINRDELREIKESLKTKQAPKVDKEAIRARIEKNEVIMKDRTITSIRKQLQKNMQKRLYRSFIDYYANDCEGDIFIELTYDVIEDDNDKTCISVDVSLVNDQLNKTYALATYELKALDITGLIRSLDVACAIFHRNDLHPAIMSIIKNEFGIGGTEALAWEGDYFTDTYYYTSPKKIMVSDKLDRNALEQAKQIGLNKFEMYKQTPEYFTELTKKNKSKTMTMLEDRTKKLLNKKLQKAMNEAVRQVYSVKNFPHELAIVFTYDTCLDEPYIIKAQIMAANNFKIADDFTPIDIGRISIKSDEAPIIMDDNDIANFLEKEVNVQIINMLIYDFKVPGRAEHYRTFAYTSKAVFTIDLHRMLKED